MNTQENHDSENKNLYSSKAIQKLQELVQHNPICLFTTMLDQTPLTTRPMAVQKVCDQGNFWFLSSIDSNKNTEIPVDNRVQLFFSNPSDSEFLSVFGKATIITDREKIGELWNPAAKAWFVDGIDDPTLSVIKVSPEETLYWDTKSGKMVSMIKIVAAIVAGEIPDIGVDGKLVVN